MRKESRLTRLFFAYQDFPLMRYKEIKVYAESLRLLRIKAPLIYVLTNNVTNQFVADSLLAIGCRPIMAIDPREIPAVVQQAQSVCINTGTPQPLSQKSYLRAIKTAYRDKTPVVLDFPGVGVSPLRVQIARQILSLLKKKKAPDWKTLIRGNPSEILTLASGKSRGGVIETIHSPGEVLEPSKKLLCYTQGYTISGKENITVSHNRQSRQAGCGAIYAESSGLGCVSSALMAAFLTLHSPYDSTLLVNHFMGDIGKGLQSLGTLKSDFVNKLNEFSKKDQL